MIKGNLYQCKSKSPKVGDYYGIFLEMYNTDRARFTYLFHTGTSKWTNSTFMWKASEPIDLGSASSYPELLI